MLDHEDHLHCGHCSNNRFFHVTKQNAKKEIIRIEKTKTDE
jgi:hypothetical protein